MGDSSLRSEEINTDIELISAGINNKFNHSHKEILEKLKKYNIKYYVTSRVGCIEVNFSEKMISTYMDKK